jgi:hypothetical protein
MHTCPRCNGLPPRGAALACLHCDAPLPAPTLLAKSGKILRALVGATGAVLLAACYGPAGRYRQGPQYGGPADVDGDGASNEIDCDDNDRNRYPGAADVFGDGVDQNCDGVDGWRDTAMKVAEPPNETKAAE